MFRYATETSVAFIVLTRRFALLVREGLAWLVVLGETLREN